ncbi:MAG: choice-of-anchor tandem repeat GloVer-containing protein [Candidatus Sulfotelmatobacter sp.]
MQSRKLASGWMAAMVFAASVLGAATRSSAQTEKVLYSFGHGADGSSPQGDLVFDASGNAYITTYAGGTHGLGTVCKLTPKANGTWAEHVLYNFGNSDTDAAQPRSGVIFDAGNRNLYGATIAGGAFGLGAVFELSPAAGGGWTEQVLFSFNGTDGQLGWNKLIFDAHGNLYSTSGIGGAYGQGVIYELSHAGGTWTQTVLHDFGNGMDGAQSQGGLIFDHAGNLYGMTTYGGANGLGMVFELSPTSGGGWTEQVLHDFAGGADGANPFAGVIFGAGGNLFGVTYFGQTVFKMTQAGTTWTLQTLHSFDDATDGSGPWPTVTLDAAGNIYGTAQFGGANNGGTAFEMRPRSDGTWGYRVTHSFPSTPNDGMSPSFTRLTFRGDETLLGVTWQGGTYGGGTMFEIDLKR